MPTGYALPSELLTAIFCWLLAVSLWLLAKATASVTAPCRDARSVRPLCQSETMSVVWLLAIGEDRSYLSHQSHQSARVPSQQLTANTFTYLYGEIRPISFFLEYPRGESQISTWIFFIFHVGANHFFRSFISFFRSFISFLRRIFYSPPGDFEISTWKPLFPDRVPYRYVVDSKLL